MAEDAAHEAHAVLPAARLVDSDGQEWELAAPVVTIGRGLDNDLVFTDESVSRRHARLELGPDGYAVVDLGSRNGTHINDELLPQGDTRSLHDGDRLMLGDRRVTYRFSTPRGPDPAPLAPGGIQEPGAPHTEQLLVVVPEIVKGELVYARISARGVLSAGTIEAFLRVCRTTLEQGVSRLVIDAAHVDFIDSTGIGGLVRLQRELDRSGGGIAIVAPSPGMRQVIELLHLATILPIFPDEAQAVAALTPSVPRPERASRRPANMSVPQLLLPDGQAWPLTGGAVSIGRDIGNDILIDSPQLAAHHARIVPIGSRHVLLDFSDQGGTYVDGERVHDLHVLRDGDTIEMADERFEFYAALSEGAPVTGTPPLSDDGVERALGVLLFKEVALTDRELTIGRAPENQLVIEDSRVSSEHAKIIRVDDDYWLLDLRSSNGTYVNEQRVPDLHLLRDGDTIAIGATIVTFKQRRIHVDDDEPEVAVSPLPVFADASGRRWLRVRILAVVLILLIVGVAAVFLRFIVQ